MEREVGSYVDHMVRGPLSTIRSNFPSKRADELMALSLSDFEQGKYVVKVRSHLLGEDIYFISSERLFDRVPEGFVVYTAKELRALKARRKDDIKNVHRIKQIFDGEVIP